MEPHGRPFVHMQVTELYDGSHVIYFLDDSDRLDVIRVLHQRQDAERHL